ncbi:transglutaminase family protein [Flammeovirgaceae bacterium SG7u.111]|nr:transglutaminase family protein [Flammeovirgaceae bacterium SG7u.132]WPO33980.1 transglutaminase family protein [Flammeovirgaceae bacterium SG7u.111]
MRFLLSHKTIYDYGGFVNLCHNEAKLTPRQLENQQCISFDLKIDPKPLDLTERVDFFGNRTYYFSIQEPHESLTVTAESLVELKAPKVPLLKDSPTCAEARQIISEKSTDEDLDAIQFILPSQLIKPFDDIEAYARESFTDDRPILEAAMELTERIFKDFKFVLGFTSVTTPLRDVAKHKKGVCQDYAQFAIACVRSVGLPARYVSGYIETLPPEGEEKMIGSDASHAWLSVYAPGIGWVDFDPTNNQMPKEQHITIAWGRDYLDITPFKGVIFSSGTHKMDVMVDMNRVEAPHEEA